MVIQRFFVLTPKDFNRLTHTLSLIWPEVPWCSEEDMWLGANLYGHRHASTYRVYWHRQPCSQRRAVFVQYKDNMPEYRQAAITSFADYNRLSTKESSECQAWLRAKVKEYEAKL